MRIALIVLLLGFMSMGSAGDVSTDPPALTKDEVARLREMATWAPTSKPEERFSALLEGVRGKVSDEQVKELKATMAAKGQENERLREMLKRKIDLTAMGGDELPKSPFTIGDRTPVVVYTGTPNAWAPEGPGKLDQEVEKLRGQVMYLEYQYRMLSTKFIDTTEELEKAQANLKAEQARSAFLQAELEKLVKP